MPDGSRPRPRGLLLDFGGVLTPSVRDRYTRFCDEEGIDPRSFRAVIRDAYRGSDRNHALVAVELGLIDRDEFERRLAAILSEGLDRPIVPDGLTLRMFGGGEMVDAMVRAVRLIRQAGVVTGMLSNSLGSSDYPDIVRDLFDDLVISGEVGLRKPDPAIFRLSLERLRLRADETVFVDDARPNVEVAGSLGISALLHDRPEDTILALEGLFGLELN